MTADVVIVGGGVVGSSIAYHLLRDGLRGRVVVVERDPTYERASSNLAFGGMRQQYEARVNVRLAQFSVRFYERFDELLRDGGHQPRIDFQQQGYLFLVTATDAERFHRRFALQRALGARVERLDREEIRQRVPDLFLGDVEFGIMGPDDGYFRPKAVLAGLRTIARAQGAEYLEGEVTEIRRARNRVAGVTIGGTERIDSGVVVNAGGPYAASVGALAGVAVPVQPVRQQLFRAALPARWPYRFPTVVDPLGLHWRHEDADRDGDPDRIVVAWTDLAEPPGENFTCDMARWTDKWFPRLVYRAPVLKGITLLEGWAGLYEMTPDHNPVLCEHPALPGFYLANGFSGHGLMLAPASGKVLSEMIRLGRSETIDVSELRVDRFERGMPVQDDATL